MKKTNKIIVPVMCSLFALTMLSGCKSQNAQETETNIQVETSAATESASETEAETSPLVNEGDDVIIVPDDQDMGGD